MGSIVLSIVSFLKILEGGKSRFGGPVPCSRKPALFCLWHKYQLARRPVSKKLYRVSKKTAKSLNEPLNNNHSFKFQNLICLWLSMPKLRF